MCKHLGQLERRSEREGWKFGKIAKLDVSQPGAQPERKQTNPQQWSDEDEADARAGWDGPAFGNLNMLEAS